MNAHKKTVILTSYFENMFDLSSEFNAEDYLICTDGGYDIAKKAGLSPDLLMGDFDSITSKLPNDIPIIRFNPVKDYTDLQLALEKALELGEENVEIWGGIGGRLDQTAANLQLLGRYAQNFASLKLRDGKNEASAICASPGKTWEIPEKKGWYLSLFSLSDTCENLNVTGTRYTLDGYRMSRNYPIGVSNEFADKNATISFDSGTLLIILSKM